MQRTRRRTLRALGATALGASIAGCSSGDDAPTDDPGDEENDDSPTDEGDDERSDGVTVQSVAVRPEVVTLNTPDSYGVYGGRSSQYVVAEVAVASPDDHPLESFAVETGGETYDTTSVGPGQENAFLAGLGGAYRVRGNDSSGWLAFSLPKPLEAETATLTWEGASHEFGEAALERLRRPPASFDVRFEAPDTVTPGETVTAAVTAENTGDVDGTFVGALNRVGPRIAYAPEAAIVLDVPGGESASWEFEHDLEFRYENREDPRMRLHLLWNDENVTREVDIESE